MLSSKSEMSNTFDASFHKGFKIKWKERRKDDNANDHREELENRG